MKVTIRWIATFVGIVCGTLVPQADAQHFDVFVADVGGKIGLGAADVGNAAFTIENRVFEGEMEENLGMTAWEADDPGFFGLTSAAAGLFPVGASALPANSNVAITLQELTIDGDTGNLFYWDGFGAPSFVLSAAGTMISLTPNAGMTTGVNGELDYHPTFSIDDAGAPTAAGIYLIALRVAIPTSALAASDPLYVVFGTEGAGGAMDDDELEQVIDAGIDWVEQNLVVPEPGTTTLAGIACIAWACAAPIRRRRLR